VAAITGLTGRPVWQIGLGQLVLGLPAAGCTFVIGRLAGVAIG
jgi:VIT1/CCC1 family predicted Fe2+/Mn2+ transporter